MTNLQGECSLLRRVEEEEEEKEEKEEDGKEDQDTALSQ
jgi:hypothetical protein